jgi:hypothetical protein
MSSRRHGRSRSTWLRQHAAGRKSHPPLVLVLSPSKFVLKLAVYGYFSKMSSIIHPCQLPAFRRNFGSVQT